MQDDKQFPRMKTGPTEQEAIAMAPENLKELSNERYERLLRDYLFCNFTYMGNQIEAQDLKKQLERRDLDTVCAYELYQMKKAFT